MKILRKDQTRFLVLKGGMRSTNGRVDFSRAPYNVSQRAFFASFERYLKKRNCGLCLMKDLQFEQTREAVQSKQRDLKRKGKCLSIQACGFW